MGVKDCTFSTFPRVLLEKVHSHITRVRDEPTTFAMSYVIPYLPSAFYDLTSTCWVYLVGSLFRENFNLKVGS